MKSIKTNSVVISLLLAQSSGLSLNKSHKHHRQHPVDKVLTSVETPKLQIFSLLQEGASNAAIEI